MLHNDTKTRTQPILVPEEGQLGSLCSNSVPVSCPSSGIYNTPDGRHNLIEFSRILKGIHTRLASCGVEIPKP